MALYFLRLALLSGLLVPLAAAELPVRGFHLLAPKPGEVPLLLRFIREALPKEGVNTLVLEIDYHYQFKSHPEVAEPDALSKDDLKAIVAACRQAGVKLIPEIDLLGHQSWEKTTYGLLRSHPEFDETPGKYPNNEGIYCRSYCPLHPAVHGVVFDLIDELEEVTESDTFHAGMDEVRVLGDDDCPRCKGKLKADLFAQEVRTVHDHLAKSKRTMWMWGDRLLDGVTTGAGAWEGSFNETFPALAQIPKDIVICDWHYENPVPTVPYFAAAGFRVISSPWRLPEVALAQLDLIRSIRGHPDEVIAPRMLGVLETAWGTTAGNFLDAYYGQGEPGPMADVVKCFRQLFAEIRKTQ